MKPASIREATKSIAAEADIALLTIRNGTASHSLPSGQPHKAVLDGLVEIVNAFALHLPDMELAINLDERPRVLVPWDELHGVTETGTHLMSGAGAAQSSGASPSQLSARQIRHMNAIACPPATPSRAGVFWNTRDLCRDCLWRHSRGQFLDEWQRHLDICN